MARGDNLRPSHLIEGAVGMLHHVEPVIDDGAVRHALVDAALARLPHFYTGDPDAEPL